MTMTDEEREIWREVLNAVADTPYTPFPLTTTKTVWDAIYRCGYRIVKKEEPTP